MEKEFCTYEQALALKELGFDEPCLAFYTHQTQLIMMNQEEEKKISIWKNSYVPLGKQYAAPLYQQAFRWFREEHGMHHGIGFNGSWYYDIDSMKNCDEAVYEVAHKWDIETYEEAEQACLDKLIEICKTKTNDR